jgi:hypothetical protein
MARNGAAPKLVRDVASDQERLKRARKSYAEAKAQRKTAKLSEIVTPEEQLYGRYDAHPASEIVWVIRDLENAQKTIHKLAKWIRQWEDSDGVIYWEAKAQRCRARLMERRLHDQVLDLRRVFAPAFETHTRIKAAKKAEATAAGEA